MNGDFNRRGSYHDAWIKLRLEAVFGAAMFDYEKWRPSLPVLAAITIVPIVLPVLLFRGAERVGLVVCVIAFLGCCAGMPKIRNGGGRIVLVLLLAMNIGVGIFLINSLVR